MKKRNTALFKMAVVLIGFIFILNKLSSMNVNAMDSTINVEGARYLFSDSDAYDVTNYSGDITSTNTSDSYGSLSIHGNLSSITNIDGYTSYEVNDGVVSISYLVDDSKLNLPIDEWHIVDDKSKKVDGITINNNIMKGAIILQASIDGEKWITESTKTNIFDDTTKTIDFYYTSDIQQVNGCYFRILIVYELGIKTGDSWLLGIDEYEYQRYAEEYKFFIIDSAANASSAVSPDTTPVMNLGDKINTGKDNGFSGEVAITSNDPHYGWDIGQFFVNGYTRNLYDTNTGNMVFLKNVGDTVTLWFRLDQDIDCLNGDSSLVISEDTNGSDQQFEIPKTNMGRGTLIIVYTDYQNVQHDPIIYTNYLEANTRTGANTRVELFEEGNYQVALDYEICNKTGIDSYTNYRIYFEFEIRNGNCMVYPFDVNTGSELSDMDITENGFKLDMAKSRYLDIDVIKSVIEVDSNGLLSEDVRFDKPAKDGDLYTDEGIYTFTVKNNFTNETVTKVIYVGESKYLQALSYYKISISELNEYISEGYIVNEDGLLIPPELENEEEIIEIIPVEVEEVISENSILLEEVEVEEFDYCDDIVSENSISENGIDGDKGDGNNTFLIVLGVVIAGGILIIVKSNKKGSKSEDNKNEQTDLDENNTSNESVNGKEENLSTSKSNLIKDESVDEVKEDGATEIDKDRL